MPPENNVALSKFQAENAALRLALYETVKQDMARKVWTVDERQYSVFADVTFTA